MFNDPLDDIDTDVSCENGFDVKLALNCSDESSGLLPLGVVPANVPMQLPFIDEFDSDEFDSDNEFRRPYIPDIAIDSPNQIAEREKKKIRNLLSIYYKLIQFNWNGCDRYNRVNFLGFSSSVQNLSQVITDFYPLLLIEKRHL